MPADFSWMGPAACELCKRLRSVDISRTEISEILGGTFAHCSQLQQLRLAKKVRRIGRNAFLNCASLGELHTPPTLLYIARHAFAGCIQLCTLSRVADKTTWRGTYAEYNAFETCSQLEIPRWVRFLPKPSDSNEEWADFMRNCVESNCREA